MTTPAMRILLDDDEKTNKNNLKETAYERNE